MKGFWIDFTDKSAFLYQQGIIGHSMKGFWMKGFWIGWALKERSLYKGRILG
jgi:hypothetical protein